ncbi:MAG: hypothetical protein JWM69_1321 [Candidatus Binatus sp.]|jgi:hypothetical protein|nr:hypothetical protein [Candidatus Binatus sp.]
MLSPAQFPLQIVKLMKAPFDSEDWLFEIKYDGFRTVAIREGGVKRVVYAELAVHVVEIISADASETICDRFEPNPFGSPISFGRVGRANDLRQLDECEIFVESVARDYRIEGAVFAVVSEFGVWNVEHGPVSYCRPVRAVRQKNEFGIGIDEFSDQPWTCNPIDLCFFTRDPFHAIA